MRIKPTGTDLLTISRRTLLDELLPLLPESAHYSARMVANAMAIAQRQLDAGDNGLSTDLAQLRKWQYLAKRPNSATLEAAWQDLDQAITDGVLDDVQDDAQDGNQESEQDVASKGRQLLWQLTWNRVAESAPRALPAT